MASVSSVSDGLRSVFMRAVSATEHIMNTNLCRSQSCSAELCLALAVALRKHPSLGATTTYFSEGEERWSTSLGLIFKQLRTLAR